MSDELRKIRKINHLKNRPEPIPETEGKGGVGDRNRDTGNRQARLDNKGNYEAKELFDASPGQQTEVQLNSRTRTADYRSSKRAKDTRDGAKLDRLQPATGIAEPIIKEQGETNPSNPFFGRCGVCNGEKTVSINCASGLARITFGDGTTEDIATPAEIEYGAKVVFSYASGGDGEIYVDSCGEVTIATGEDDDSESYTENVYGQFLYRQLASSVIVNGISLGNIKEFQVYGNQCTVTVVAVLQQGDRRVVNQADCADLSIGYTPVTPSSCVSVGGQKVCGIDPNTVQYQCVVRGTRLCQKYYVRWVIASTGESVGKESCEPLGYDIVSEPVTDLYRPGTRSTGTSILKYDSGLPRKFAVDVSGVLYDSGEYAYFQVYQSVTNPCEYEIVGVKVKGAKTFVSGAITSKEYQTIYTGKCGFRILLGGYTADQYLRIYDDVGEIILETGDFVPSSVDGCPYIDGTGLETRFNSAPPYVCRATEITRVNAFEKTTDANVDDDSAQIISIECLT